MAGLKRKELRTIDDLTIKQKVFVETLVKNWGNMTQAEALKHAKYECKNENDYSVIASRLLNRKLNPHVVKYFDQRVQPLSIQKILNGHMTNLQYKAFWSTKINFVAVKDKMI